MSKNPFQTGIAVANSMVGTSLLVVPINFLKTGIIQNLIAAMIMSVLMGSTAVAISTFLSAKQKQFFQIVKKQLGVKWSNVMAMLGAIITLLVGGIVFLLTTSILYQIFSTFSTTIEQMGSKLFRSLLIIFFLPFCLLSSLEPFVRFSFVSMSLMWFYLLNFNNIDINAFEWKELSPQNVQFWLSVQGYSFICHPTLDAVLKQNKQSHKNKFAVIVGYAFSFVVMASCGFLGSLALYKKTDKDTNIVIDYFKGQWQYYALGVSLSIYLISIFPFFPYTTRSQIYQILPQKFKANPNKTHKIMKLIFVLVFTVMSLLFVLFNTNPGSVMGFIASFVCFYICYFLPLYIKMKFIKRADYLQIQQKKYTLITQTQQYNQSNKTQVSNSQQTIQQALYLIPQEPKRTRDIYFALYGIILIFGTALMIGEIYSLIHDLVVS